MGTNEFYYIDWVSITRDEAHERIETSKWVVTAEAKTKAECKEALGVSE